MRSGVRAERTATKGTHAQPARHPCSPGRRLVASGSSDTTPQAARAPGGILILAKIVPAVTLCSGVSSSCTSVLRESRAAQRSRRRSRSRTIEAHLPVRDLSLLAASKATPCTGPLLRRELRNADSVATFACNTHQISAAGRYGSFWGWSACSSRCGGRGGGKGTGRRRREQSRRVCDNSNSLAGPGLKLLPAPLRAPIAARFLRLSPEGSCGGTVGRRGPAEFTQRRAPRASHPDATQHLMISVSRCDGIRSKSTSTNGSIPV